LFSWLLTRYNFPTILSKILFGISDNPLFILFVINLIFFFGGMFIEGLALIIMFVPILLPIATSVGIDPLAFGIMVIVNIALGTLTPPVGVCLFVAASASRVKLDEVSKSAFPFVGVLVLVLILIVVFPALITFLPTVLQR
jgi:C4-dicarboxylate transporter DctM subunit